jgi:hypothetical protein
VSPLHYDTFPPLETDLDTFRQEFEDAGFEPMVLEVEETTTV